jgi:hypothetical protein
MEASLPVPGGQRRRRQLPKDGIFSRAQGTAVKLPEASESSLEKPGDAHDPLGE